MRNTHAKPGFLIFAFYTFPKARLQYFVQYTPAGLGK